MFKNIKDIIIDYLVANHDKIKITKRDYVNKYLVPVEKSATFKDLEPMFKHSRDFCKTEDALKFVKGLKNELILCDSFDTFTISQKSGSPVL